MAITKTHGIVIHSMRYRETSKILTIFSRDYGILKLIAKGARTAKSRFAGALEPMNVIELVYYQKENRDLQLLSQASILYAPKSILLDEHKTLLAMACCEMVSRLEAAGGRSNKVFGLLRGIIQALDESKANDDRLLLFAFQLRLLKVLGYAPGLYRCFVCGNETPEGAYHIAEARFYCPACSPGGESVFPLHPWLLWGLRQLTDQPLRRIGELEFAPGVLSDTYRFLQAFYNYHLEELGFLKSLEVMKQMKALSNSVSAEWKSQKVE